MTNEAKQHEPKKKPEEQGLEDPNRPDPPLDPKANSPLLKGGSATLVDPNVEPDPGPKVDLLKGTS